MTAPPHQDSCGHDETFYTENNYDVTCSVGYLLRENTRLAVNMAEACFSSADISFSQWIALFLLWKGKVENVGELAELVSITSGAATRLVDQLEHRELVQRNRSSIDRRVVHLTLTPAGETIAARSLSNHLAAWNAVLGHLGQKDACALIDILERLLMSLTYWEQNSIIKRS